MKEFPEMLGKGYYRKQATSDTTKYRNTFDGTVNTLFSVLKSRAKYGNLKFDITHEDVKDLLATPTCSLPWCGKPINYDRMKGEKKWDSATITLRHMGDGYVKSNMVCIHFECFQQINRLTQYRIKQLLEIPNPRVKLNKSQLKQLLYWRAGECAGHE